MKLERRDELSEPTVQPDVATRPAILVARLALGTAALGLVAGAYLLLHAVGGIASVSDIHVSRFAIGFLATILLVLAVALYLAVRRDPELPLHPASAGKAGERTQLARARQHARWFVHMRWVAALVSVTLILIAVPVGGVLPNASLIPLLGWWVVLVIANTLFAQRLRWVQDLEHEIFLQGVLDLVVLTGWLNASGGIENPLYEVFILHVIIAGTLLPRRRALTMTAIACSLVSLLALAEYLQVVPHVTIEVFPHDHEDAASVGAVAHEHASLDPVFVLGRLVPFISILFLVAYLTTMIADRLRHSQAELEETAHTEESERRRLEGVIHSAGIGVVVLDPDFVVRWYGGRAAEWFDLTPESLGVSCASQGSDGDLACLVDETLTSARPAETERVVTRPGGELRHFRHATWPVADDSGRVEQVVKLVEDITARKALEAEAVHAGKLSALGKMAAAVAHEINNPLASLASRIALMERSDEPRFWRESLDLLKGQISRISRIVHTVSQFGRAPFAGRTTWDVQPAVEEALNVVRLDPRAANATITWRPSPAPIFVTAVRDQVVQAYLNLLINAVEAIPDGGELTVRAFAYNGEVGVAIRDSGEGIDEAVEHHLFEPFATTKPSGTGIGLAISHSLVHGHGGRIEVLSEQGEGSCFTVYLPQAHPDDGSASDSRSA